MHGEPYGKDVDELCRLVNTACDGVLTEPQRVRLNELLSEGVEMRSAYLRYIALHSSLTTTAGSQAIQGIEEFATRLVELAAAAPAAPTPRRGRGVQRRVARPWLWRAAAASVLLVLALGYFAANRPISRDVDLSVELANQGVDAETPLAAASEVPQPVVVRVERVSANVRWSDPNASYAAQAGIRSGVVMKLDEGEVDVVYETGVRLVLVGPAEFAVRAGGGELRRGSLMASVPKAGHGFTIETPTGKVIDLGTQFGIVVDDFGVSEVSVFEGKVEAFPRAPATLVAADAEKFELTEGRALQWSAEMVKPLEADPRRLPFSLVGHSPLNAGRLSSPRGDANWGGAAPRIDESQWRAVGDVRRSPGWLALTGDAQHPQRPYLVSTREYNPSNGPLTVLCDVRFQRVKSGDLPSFAILTRSEDERSEVTRPWADVLASCVRCNFRTMSDGADGVLETATKYERDRELTGVSWSGFRRPQESVVYRLVMRDDGVNVSFTVSQLDDPAVAKTVTCRSLFRGYRNFVALEGWDAGDVIVERAAIFQDPPAESLAGRFARPRRSTSAGAESASSNPLLARVPDDAELVLDESFSGDGLDPDAWTTLGDVEVDDGAVSLGRAEAGAHIDTFHPRPYLLTRRRFTPRESKLFVLGRIELAENFLQGYGGSFAVMTRCSDRYAVGPEWAVSALGTGVRANFWPAASHEEHVLEIHEKLDDNLLTYLAGARLRVRPESRAYFFCVEDDGKQAILTLRDALHPAVGETLSQRTDSVRLESGFVAFESCWGSPVRLDDVRIYASGAQPEAQPKMRVNQ